MGTILADCRGAHRRATALSAPHARLGAAEAARLLVCGLGNHLVTICDRRLCELYNPEGDSLDLRETEILLIGAKGDSASQESSVLSLVDRQGSI